MKTQNEYVCDVRIPCRVCKKWTDHMYIVSMVAVVTGFKFYNNLVCRMCENHICQIAAKH